MNARGESASPSPRDAAPQQPLDIAGPEGSAEPLRPPADSGNASDVQKQRAWSSEELFGSQREVTIVHGDQVYRLRQTRQGKLILYK